MSPVFEKRAPSNKLTITKGSKLADLAPGVSLEDIGRYNWGTKEKAEINRALIELVGCQKVDDGNPLQSELDPMPGARDVHKPVAWKPETESYDFDDNKTLTVKLKKQLPMPAVEITELTSWFTPDTGSCSMKYRLEGVAPRADKTDIEVHVARYRTNYVSGKPNESLSSYYEVRVAKRDTDPSKALDPNNPDERNEVACGTEGDKDTHIWREHKDNVAPSASEAWSWKGESKAKKGELDSTSGKKYINSSFAPYSVLVRYYKSPDDKEASISFQESFYPRWTVGSGKTRTLDAKSLIVRWQIKHGTKKKLAHGQILVFKGNAVVCRVPLDSTKLDSGELDLGPHWPASSIKREDMPYRVQIQAHSGPDEPDGLALAVMPTQVRAYRYKKAQFVAFHVRPPSPYAGNANHDLDITARCTAMIDAVKAATVDPSEDILKIFMAPEFYFRGPEGAYPVEKIETIMPKLRAESDKIEYKDWMFVFGTAIGYEKQDPGGTATMIEHKTLEHQYAFSRITTTGLTVKPLAPNKKQLPPKKGWVIVQGTNTAKILTVTKVRKYKEYQLTFKMGPTFARGAGSIRERRLKVLETDPASSSAVTRIRVKWKICELIPSTTSADRQWTVSQSSTVTSAITACARHPTNKNEFWLTLATPGKFKKGKSLTLKQPPSTEITNVALVQKGYPSPYMGDGQLNHAAIYKEYISHIDFARNNHDWKVDTGRKVLVHGTADRPVVPTPGSVDLGGGVANDKRRLGSTVGSEINKTGVGGGVVYTMNDITFGLEVCLDHGKDQQRLWNFYSGSTPQAVAGDPKTQILLIPSWGMSIGGGKVYAPPSGPVFNVDGARGDSVARLHDGTSSCDEHPAKTGTLTTPCPEPVRTYLCPTCNLYHPAPGNCVVHTATPLVAWVTCAHTPRKACNGGCLIGKRCNHPKTMPFQVCNKCGAQGRHPVACACTPPILATPSWQCKNFYTEATGACPDCGQTVLAKCPEKFAALGSPVAVAAVAKKVPSATTPYFTALGSVLSYAAVDIPQADAV